MQLVNEFVVPRPIEAAWEVLTDVERIAPCMPGAQLGDIVDDVYHGTVKVKVGPVTAAYAGTATFRERDEVAHHMVLDATGKEKAGRGRASAVVTADLAAEGDKTRVRVVTDLTISGPLAQFGRGAIAEVSTKLLNQFVESLKETVLADGAGPAPAAVEAATAQAPSAVRPVAATVPAAPAGVDVLRVAAWPILKRLVPAVVVVAVVVVLLVWLL
jgi:carbon monoxide dehydrogenase subunit G